MRLNLPDFDLTSPSGRINRIRMIRTTHTEASDAKAEVYEHVSAGATPTISPGFKKSRLNGLPDDTNVTVQPWHST